MAALLPKRKEWQTLFDMLSKREKVLFLVLFSVMWISGTLILISIDKDFSTQIPATGGSITEGVVGSAPFINPLLAISDGDNDLVRLIYAGLMRPDGKGGFVPQLAESYTVSDDGLSYTFTLRENLVWHDNNPVTTEDVAFTIALAKNPEVRSTKFANWEGVAVEIVNDREITFHLKRPYSPFLGNTTLGILPKHIWDSISPGSITRSKINTRPIGSGPFKIDTVAEKSDGTITSYTLARFKNYQPEPAHLKKIHYVFFQKEEDLKEALNNGSVDSGHLRTVLDKSPKNETSLDIILPNVFGVFLNQNDYEIFRDPILREALTLAIDRQRIVNEVVGGKGTPTTLPIPPGTFAYASTLDDISFDKDKAHAMLLEVGYEDSDGDGYIEKVVKEENIPVAFTIATSDAPELKQMAELVANMWRAIGINVKVEFFEQGDFKQEIIRPRNYQALLFGQVLGYETDPLGFWHTRQIQHPGSNIALYANTKVDKLLDDAHKTIDRDTREELFTFFQEEILKDKPAVFLYSPLYVYIVPSALKGTNLEQIPLPQERFSTVELWYTHTKSIWNILL